MHSQITTVNNFIAVSSQNDPAMKRLPAVIVRVTVAQCEVKSAKIGMALDARLNLIRADLERRERTATGEAG
jgi:hypothetical protein